MRDPAAVEPLIEALRDPFVDIPWLAAKSTGNVGDIRVVILPLLEALKSNDKWLRVGAVWGLGKLRDLRAVDPLVPLIRYSRKMVRKNSICVLENIADKHAVPWLIESLRDTYGEVREAAQAALVYLAGTGA